MLGSGLAKHLLVLPPEPLPFLRPVAVSLARLTKTFKDLGVWKFPALQTKGTSFIFYPPNNVKNSD